MGINANFRSSPVTFPDSVLMTDRTHPVGKERTPGAALLEIRVVGRKIPCRNSGTSHPGTVEAMMTPLALIHVEVDLSPRIPVSSVA